MLLEAARAFVGGLEPAARDAFRFLHVSTDEVYGTLGASGLFSEETPYAPNSPYAASKAAADHLVRASFHTYGLPVLITNCSNNYGPFQFPEKLIPLMLLNALDGTARCRSTATAATSATGCTSRITAPGSCSCSRRGAPARNTISAAATSARTSRSSIASATRSRRCARRARTRRSAASSYRELKTFVPDRPGHDRRYAIDATKIRRELGWAPRHAFEEGLAATARWYVEHRDWCEQVQAGYDRERLGKLKSEVRTEVSELQSCNPAI